MGEVMTGVGRVKWFNRLKGYGFIVPDDGGADIFVHMEDIRKTGFERLLEGWRVSFRLVASDGGKPRASEIMLIKPTP